MKIRRLESRVETVVSECGVRIPIIKGSADFGGIKKVATEEYSVIFKCHASTSDWHGFTTMEQAIEKYIFLYNLCKEKAREGVKSLEPIEYIYQNKSQN